MTTKLHSPLVTSTVKLKPETKLLLKKTISFILKESKCVKSKAGNVSQRHLYQNRETLCLFINTSRASHQKEQNESLDEMIRYDFSKTTE